MLKCHKSLAKLPAKNSFKFFCNINILFFIFFSFFRASFLLPHQKKPACNKKILSLKKTHKFSIEQYLREKLQKKNRVRKIDSSSND